MMDDDLTRDIGSPLAGDDEILPLEETKEDDLDDNFDRELREAEQDLEATDPPTTRRIQVNDETEDDE